jgi:alcohol dehydrogenase class IV
MTSWEGFYNTSLVKRLSCPTRLVWGEGTRGLAAEALGDSRTTLLVVDEAFADHPEVLALLPTLSIRHRVHVAGEPDSASLEGTIAALPPGLDSLLCIGGGSTMDTGKALRAHLAYGAWAVKDSPPIAAMPRLVAMPTLAASGSEMSRYYVVADAVTHEKRAYRAWSLAPDVALLDPVWMAQVPGPLRFAGALDAFTHLYESLLCRQERSWFNDAVCREGLARLKDLAPCLLQPEAWPAERILKLQYAAALGGLALSNVRTGLLHDAGEALAAQVSLPHPLTLRVFLPALLALHRPVSAERLEGLGPDAAHAAFPGEGWADLWLRGAATWGLDARIRSAFQATPPTPDPIVAKVLSDRVLMDKESPVPLDEATVRDFVERSLDSLRPAST